VSTDEVYGDIEPGYFSKEDDKFEPNSPYAASKAAGELLVRAYHITHGMDTVVTRGSNTYGPYQYPEKIIPFFVTEAIDDRPLPVYGNGMQIRDWLYVDDHALGVAAALFHGQAGEAYNIAGEHHEHNINVTHRILDLLGKPRTLIKHVPDREGHDVRYAMNCDKLRALGWERQYTFDQGLVSTIDWYRSNEWWWRKIKTGEYLEFYKQQYAARLAAADADQS
jgi:dTDP-glucose 4,6-dehydratase